MVKGTAPTAAQLARLLVALDGKCFCDSILTHNSRLRTNTTTMSPMVEANRLIGTLCAKHCDAIASRFQQITPLKGP